MQMFETKKTLIVVYKDELLMNQLKKMVETHDDAEGQIVGTRDDSVNIISWSEKVWLDNKKAGNIQGKILFLGDISGTDKLIPVIDTIFDAYGVKYGWAGNQAVLYADTKVLTKRKDYDAFLKELSTLPVPSFLKTSKQNMAVGTDAAPDVLINEKPAAKKPEKFGLLKAAIGAIGAGASAIEKVGSSVAVTSEELFRDKSLMKQQMLFYGLVKLYYNDLESFMNL